MIPNVSHSEQHSKSKASEEFAISQGNWIWKTPAQSKSEVGWVVSKILNHLWLRLSEAPCTGSKVI